MIANKRHASEFWARVSHPLVGRQRERLLLDQALEDARRRLRRFLIITGEPGIGKTSLAVHFSERAQAAGARVLCGRGWEGDGAPPFWTWTQILRAHIESLPEAEREPSLGPRAHDLAALVPELLPPAAHTCDLDVGSPDLDAQRFRLFDAVAGLLQATAAERPLVLVFDDLHAADLATLRLLQFVVRDGRCTNLALVATCSEAEIPVDSPESGVLAQLTREGQRIPLRGLARDEVHAMIQERIEIAPNEALVTRIYEATEGNPFFVDELVHLLSVESRLDGPGAESLVLTGVSNQIHAMVRRRLRDWSEADRHWLSLAAVMGREFHHVLFRHAAEALAANTVWEATPIRLQGVLREACHAGILRESVAQPGVYRFVHGIVREALCSSLSLPERVAASQALARALATMPGGELERHAAEASADSLHLFEQALDAVGSADSIWRARLLARLAREMLGVGAANGRGKALAVEATAMAERLEDPDTLAQVRAECQVWQGTLIEPIEADGIGDSIGANGSSQSCGGQGDLPVAPQDSSVDEATIVPLDLVSAPGERIFRREGEYWTLAFSQQACRMRDAKGLVYVHWLLRHPGRQFHATELLVLHHENSGADSALASPRRSDGHLQVTTGLGDAGEVFDAQARDAYARRLTELEEELAEARDHNDPGRIETAHREIEFLVLELRRATGLGGRERRSASHSERARVNVTRAIRGVLQRIAKYHPPLGEHLDHTIRTGTFCCYLPDPRASIEWRLS